MKFEGIPDGSPPPPQNQPGRPHVTPTPPHPKKCFFHFLALGPGTYLTRSGPKFHAGGWSRFVKPRHMCRETPVFVLEVIWAQKVVPLSAQIHF